jgi:anti-sigma B factor antagonist
MIHRREVTVEQIQAAANADQEQAQVQRLVRSMSPQRPCFVLDCSGLNGIDRSAMRIMLRCLEEALKRNGDVRLSAVSPIGKAAIESTGVARLFRIFATSAAAIASYRNGHADCIPPETALSGAGRESEDAA